MCVTTLNNIHFETEGVLFRQVTKATKINGNFSNDIGSKLYNISLRIKLIVYVKQCGI